uniref:Uncharacterized protein n=1 Tax=Anopheles dirus TaxID=7168 RepID=A0A182NTP2_9DIPT
MQRSLAPLSNDVDQMEEMEAIGLVGCNHAVTVTVLPPPAFTDHPEPRQASNDSEPSVESNESNSASNESPNARETQTENR